MTSPPLPPAEPHFLHAIDYGNYVYFFLSEISVEYTALGKVSTIIAQLLLNYCYNYRYNYCTTTQLQLLLRVQLLHNYCFYYCYNYSYTTTTTDTTTAQL